MANSRKLNETRTNAQKTGYSIIIRGLQVDTSISGNGIDGRLIAGGFEANSLGVTVGALYANGSLGANNYVLRTNGTNTFWGPAPAGGGGGGNTAGYLQVANAVATYQTIAIERAALANTNAFIKTKANWSSLTSTNTALRTLISDRLQVANAAATYQTKATELAHLANTNAYIATKTSTTTFNAALANTNAYIATKVATTTFNSALANTNAYITTKLNTSTAASTYQTIVIERAALANTNAYIATKVATTTFNSALANTNAYIATKIGSSNPTTSGLFAHTGRATISTNLLVSGNTTLGAAGKTITTTGLLGHTGRATISTNLAVSGNTLTNKIVATNRLESYGNNVLGSAGKTQIINGILASNGNITVTKNLTISGNTTYVAIIGPGIDSRGKIALWNSTTYAIGMGSAYTFGPLNNYAMTFQMDATSNRGWWWGQSGHTNAQGAMALDNIGHLTVARKIRIGYGNSDATDVASWNAGFDLSGNMYVSGNTRVNALGVGTTAGTNGSIRATNDITAYYSDERLKTIIEVIPNPLDKVKSLRGFIFTPNETAQSLGYKYKREVGVSAQEVQRVLPEIVVAAPISDDYLTVKYEKLIPLLIEALKEVNEKVDRLEARLANGHIVY